MCGIAGIVTKTGAPPDEGLLRRMATALAHRGPDGEGIWSAPGVGLAHRRLSIIDLASRASQPMEDARGEYRIIFNGEIYNYRELRSELNAAWKTESDTEVILEGYRMWGDDVVTKLRGMFAFALWDSAKRRLLIARDRTGKKPLFYTHDGKDDLYFASEIKAFKGIVDLKPDWNAIRLFLGLQYVPSPLTGFEGVKQLEPGSIGVWDGKEFTTRKYNEWSVVGAGSPRPDRPAGTEGGVTPPLREQEIDQGIRSRLEEAVKIRQLAADVPVGAFLSGGIDSAAVVAYATKHAFGPLQTFTMGFPTEKMDERKEASAIARHFGTSHHEFEARPQDLLELVDTLVDHYDAPYADSSALPLWLLSRETAKHIKVVLTGDGGDETFGGYRRYVAYQRVLQIPGVVAPFLQAIGKVGKDPRFTRMAESVESRSYGEMFCGSYFASNALSDVCKPEFLERTKGHDAVEYVESVVGAYGGTPRAHYHAPLQAAMMFDLTSYLPDDLNVKMDRATMAFGLEARAPFLDQEMVNFAVGLPLKQKVNRGKTKIALKRALKGVVPDEVLERKKRGFQVPLAEWFRGPLEPMLRERCLGTSSPLRSIMRIEAIERLIEENKRGSDHGNRLWMLLTLSTWLKKFS